MLNRSINTSSFSPSGSEEMNKKIKPSESATSSSAAVLKDDNLLFEILKHVDARTLGAAACVSSQWKRTAYDERLWELICTKYRGNTAGFSGSALRLVVLALGGFRCLYSNYLLRLSKPSFSVAISSSYSTVAAATSTSSSSSWPCLPPPRTIVPAKPTATAAPKTRWGKDEIQLSLSLLSTRYFAKLNADNINK